jgi:rhodanese-related sulfurtransferase
MQASEAIKLISGTGEPLINQMLIYNSYTNHTYKVSLTAGEQQSVPSDLDAFLKMDYNWFCGISDTAAEVKEISTAEFMEVILDNEYTIIDVREPGELPDASGFEHIQLPLSVLRKQVPEISGDKFILFCHSGVRSIIAGELLQEVYPDKEFYSLKGGILRLN